MYNCPQTAHNEIGKNKLGGLMQRSVFGISSFLFGGFLYGLVEILFRGYTHVSMFVLGGICFVCIGWIRRAFCRAPLAKRMLLCSGMITVLEFLCGLLVNVALGLSVWDYSAMPMNLLGQVCPSYSAAWCLLSVPAMGLDAVLQRHLDLAAASAAA